MISAMELARRQATEKRVSDGPVADGAFQRGFGQGWRECEKYLAGEKGNDVEPQAPKFNREVWVNPLAQAIHATSASDGSYKQCVSCKQVAERAFDAMTALFRAWLIANAGDSREEGKSLAQQFADDVQRANTATPEGDWDKRDTFASHGW